MKKLRDREIMRLNSRSQETQRGWDAEAVGRVLAVCLFKNTLIEIKLTQSIVRPFKVGS